MDWTGVGARGEIDQGRDTVWAYYIGDGDLIDCGAGDDVLHLHQDIDGLRTRGCETILIAIARPRGASARIHAGARTSAPRAPRSKDFDA